MEITQTTSHKILVIGASLIVFMSFAGEYLLEITPCRLCLAQRGLYFGLIALGTTTMSSKAKWAHNMCLLTILALFCVSSYHGLIELGILNDRCQTLTTIENSQSLKNALKNPGPCLKNSWRLLTIPAPIWNVIISIGFICLLNRKTGTKKYEKS